MTGKFIKLNDPYDFVNEMGVRIKGQNFSCFINNEITKVNLSEEQVDLVKDCKFGDEIALDVSVKGKYANYILAV